MSDADEFREIALGLPDAIESSHMGHPDFRANGRIFAGLMHDGRTGTANLTPEEQAELMRTFPGVFAPASGAWGRQGWTTVKLSAARKPELRSCLHLAWQNVASLPPKKPAKKSGARTKVSSLRVRPNRTR